MMADSPCTRCQVNPRLPGQRWCRDCLSQYQRERRAQQTTATVGQHEASGLAPGVIQPSPTPLDVIQTPPPPLSEAQRQALEEYWNAVQEYTARRQIDRGWMPMDRSTVLVPLWQKVQAARQRLAQLGVDPETL
jgi:hypothetical protein